MWGGLLVPVVSLKKSYFFLFLTFLKFHMFIGQLKKILDVLEL